MPGPHFSSKSLPGMGNAVGHAGANDLIREAEWIEGQCPKAVSK